MGAIHLRAEDFVNEVLEGAAPVLVDFYAEWCGPCKMMAPILDEVADALQGKVLIFKMNVDEAQEIASQFRIMSIPTLLLFKNGQVVDQMVGVMPKDQLIQKIKENL